MKIKNNPLLRTASGMFGNSFVCRESRGVLVMSNRPKKPETLTAHQLSIKARFLQGVLYAKAQVGNPLAKADYETGVNNKLVSAYHVALADFLKGPEVHALDASAYTGAAGGTILITATDNFKVTSVHVEIYTNNELIESGYATISPENPTVWVYAATMANASVSKSRVVVKAKDKPNNVTTREFEL